MLPIVLRWGMTFDELLKSVCKVNAQVARYLGEHFTLSKNWRARHVLERLLNHSHIKCIREKPVTLQWIEDSNSEKSNTGSNDDSKGDGGGSNSTDIIPTPSIDQIVENHSEGYDENKGATKDNPPNKSHSKYYRQ